MCIDTDFYAIRINNFINKILTHIYLNLDYQIK